MGCDGLDITHQRVYILKNGIIDALQDIAVTGIVGDQKSLVDMSVAKAFATDNTAGVFCPVVFTVWAFLWKRGTALF